MQKSNEKLITRNILFDIAKGIGILLVVFGHAHMPHTNFISLFHVALFFIISGYFIKDYNFENLKNILVFIKKRLKSLWVPFFVCNTSFILLNNLFIKLNIYTTNPAFLTGDIGNKFGLNEWLSLKAILIKIGYFFVFAYQTPLGGTTWFLRVLFYGSVCYIVLSFCLKKLIKKELIYDITRGIFCFIILLVGFYLSLLDFRFYQIGTICSILILIFIGNIYSKIEKYIKFNIYIGTLCFLILVIILRYNPCGISIPTNKYINPFLFILSSSLGFMFILCISQMVSKFSCISKILSYIGQHTMSIICLHFLCFKFVTLIIVHLYKLPDYRLASFPVYWVDNWWIIYGIIGAFSLYFYLIYIKFYCLK